MTKKKQHQYILPTRFRLRKNALETLGVHVFTSNWREEADNLARKHLGPQKRAKTNLFNQAALSLSPVLVHGIKYTGMADDLPLHQMLALAQYPGEKLVKSLARHWADIWLDTSFPEDSRSRAKQDAQKLYDLIEDTENVWVEKNALEALNDGKNKLRYSALPSLIAAQFATAGTSKISGRIIKWGLAQQGDNGVAVVSEPQTANGSTFAYLIRFSLQYQPGNSEPWIHAAITCQRYMDEKFESGNKNRNATILLRLQHPLHLDWAHNQTLVRLPVWNASRKATKQDDAPKFPDGFHTLLDRAKARSIIRDPMMILENPARYRSEDDDNYYVLYAEGYEPQHPLGSGFGAQERTEIFRDLENKIESILLPGNAIPLFKGCLESRALDSWKSTETKAPKNPVQKRDLRLNALRAANNAHPIRILLAYINEDMGNSMYHFLVKRHLKIGDGDVIPSDIQIEKIKIPDSLDRPLEFNDESGLGKAQKKVDAEKVVAGEWQDFLKQYKGADNIRTYAWIELPSKTSDFTSPHNAIRMACVKEGIASQMIHKLRSKFEYVSNMGRYSMVATAVYDFGRLYNACGDLILRQAGVAAGDTLKSELADDYKKAGFPPDVAEKLTVIGLTVFKNRNDYYRGRGAATVPVATRILPDGKVEAKIPSVCDWTDYFYASIALGNAFIKNQRNASFDISSSTLFSFVKEILAEHMDSPALLILDAYKLRSVWDYLKVDSLKIGQVAFGGDSFTSASMPNMNIVWLRQSGDGETPQYVATDEITWTEAYDADRIAHASLFEDGDANSSLRHFFSVGRLDNNKKADQSAMRHEEGSEMNFRNQQMLELVPVMGNYGEASIAVTHMLRSSPAWETGNTVLPYPIHLANKMIEDMIPLLGVEDENQEEG